MANKHNTTLRPYMCYALDPQDGALLVFAYTAVGARKVAMPTMIAWFDADYFDIRAVRLKRNAKYFMSLKVSDEPHCIEEPPVCNGCDAWTCIDNECGE